ncbi:MAG: Spy/CpxP family protein refolding chaperone [Gammaproteobacteria bacterium]|nr:Spy/CpxP family protein refolding chaperone [Gammaproteobacteria bacterium]
MKRTRTILLTTLAATGIVVAAAVAAGPRFGGCQQGYGPGDGPMMQGGGYGPGRGMHGGWHQGRYDPAMHEQRLEQMHERLAITAEQEPAWQAFVAQMDAQRARMQAHHEQMRTQWSADEALSLPERIQRHAEFMGERLGAMSDMARAAETLYGQLTPEQQAQLDRAPMAMGGRHGPRGF